MLSTVFDSSAYNALEGPEVSYASLRRRKGFDDFLLELRELTVHSPWRNYFGAVLLHRHFEADAGGRLVERPVLLEDCTRALVTRPTSAPIGVPIRWRLSEDGTFLPLEYSIDDGPRRLVPRLAMDHGLLRDYAALLRRYGIADVIGLCIMASKYLVLGPGKVLSELTTDAGSVTTLQSYSDDPSLVPTAWVPALSMACRIECKANCRPGAYGSAHTPVHNPRHMY